MSTKIILKNNRGRITLESFDGGQILYNGTETNLKPVVDFGEIAFANGIRLEQGKPVAGVELNMPDVETVEFSPRSKEIEG